MLAIHGSGDYLLIAMCFLLKVLKVSVHWLSTYWYLQKWGLSGSHATTASNGYTVPVMMINDCRTLVDWR